MARNAARPLSPHLTIWRWGPHMLVSILHRATGTALAIGGGIVFTWWLVAAASGAEAYARFTDLLTVRSGNLNIVGLVLFVGLTWSFLQHAFSGLRHFVMDTGAGYELKTNKTFAWATIGGSLIVTLLLWMVIILTKGAH